MRLGMIVRANDARGLSRQTAIFHRALKPAKTLVVQMGDLTPYPEDPSEFLQPWMSTTVTDWQGGHLHDDDVRWLLRDVDVIWSAETFYDDRLTAAAATVAARTVLHSNREFCRWVHNTDNQHPPDAVVYPSSWMVPNGALVLPTPIEHVYAGREFSEPVTFVHVAGHPAHADRDGTRIVMEMAPLLDPGCRLIVWGRTELPDINDARCEVEVRSGVTLPTDELYAEADVIVAPRRYGGQYLVRDEAMARGIPVLMGGCPPNDTEHPASMLVSARRSSDIGFAVGGTLPTYRTLPGSLANRCNQIARDPSSLDALSRDAISWSNGRTWRLLKPQWDAVLTGDVATV